MNLLFIINTPEFFLSHRLPLAVAARNAGFTVHIATGPGTAYKKIIDLGFTHHPLPISRSGQNPLYEAWSLWTLYRLMRKIKPDLVHLVTIKPVLYGGLMARLAGVPAMIAAISGLGTVFTAQSYGSFWMRKVVEFVYRLSLRHPNERIIFQNPDDRSKLIDIVGFGREQSVLIKGSGVSIPDYPMHPEPEGIPVITFAARLLKDKGVREFAEAAKILKERGVVARFLLAGSTDPGNPTSISDDEVSAWAAHDLLEPLGHLNDIASLFSKSNVVVLPSYREGLPKVLIEAASCGRAVVTTDVPGCRDAIEPNVSGLLVPARDAKALADAIQSLISDPLKRKRMGSAGHALAEREFSIEKVVSAHLDIYRDLLKKGENL